MKFVLLTLFITITLVNIVNCHEEALQTNEPLSIQETKQDNLQLTIDSKNVFLTRLTRSHGKGGGYSSCNTCGGQAPVYKPQVQHGGGCTTCGGGGGGSGSFSQSSSQSSSGSFSGNNGKKK